MELKFISRIKKGNNQGTGFFYLPKDKTNSFNLGDWIQVNLLKNKFFAKVIFYSHRLGVYVPKYIMLENHLINKETEIQIKKVDGFYAKIYRDGRINIPKDIVENQKLKHNDIVLIKGMENDKIVQKKYSKIHVIKRKNKSAEYLCVFDKNFYGKQFLFKIEKQSPKAYKEKLNSLATRLLKEFHFAFIDKDSVIIFKSNKVPAIASTKIKYPDIAFYLGAYFSDGTRKGNSWAICASTFEQARYYLEMHNSLIKDSKPEFTISYTNIYKIDRNKLKKRLREKWKNEVGISLHKFRILEPKGKLISKKWHRYGTLVIREHKQILLDFYNALLKLLINEILSKKNTTLATDFICGVMEGDGCASATKRGHVMIFANKDDVHPLEEILKVTQIRFKVNKEGENRYSLRIGALEILRNFHLLKDKIFSLYPKRKGTFFERLNGIKTVKFLIENHEPTSGVKAWLRNNGFCDRDYKLTEKGLKLREGLLNEIKSVR